MDVDLEDWGVIDRWMDQVVEGVAQLDLPTAQDYLQLSMPEEDTGVSRTRPFMATMTVGSTHGSLEAEGEALSSFH